MEIRKQEPPEYGEKILFKVIESDLALKNALIDDVLSNLDEKNFLDEDETVWSRLCFDEVIVNAIRHGNNEDKSKKVTVALYANEKQWAIRVLDEGEGFCPEDVPDVEDEDSPDLEGGRGILLMKNFMDEIWYYNNGSCVQLMRFRRGKLRKILDKILTFLKIK